jgi:hypothetical protein
MSELQPEIWELGRQYDEQQKGPKRHLAVYPRNGYFEVAWELNETDGRRVSVPHRDWRIAMHRLAGHISDRVR